MAGFKNYGQMRDGEGPVTQQVLIANSQTIAVGDALKLQTLASGGGAMRASAGSKVLGICVGIVDANGIDLVNTSPSNFDGTFTDGINPSYSASSNNMTNKLVKALVVTDPDTLWYNDAAGDMVAADEYKYFDLTTYAQIADQDGNDTAGAFQLIKRNPDNDGDASKGLFKVAETYVGVPAVQQ